MLDDYTIQEFPTRQKIKKPFVPPPGIFDKPPMIGTPEAEYPGWNGGRPMPKDPALPSGVETQPAPLPRPQPAEAPKPSSGMNSVGEALKKAADRRNSHPLEVPDNSAAQFNVPQAAQPSPTQAEYPTGSPPSMRLSQLASKQAELRELQRAPLNAPVTVDSYGLPVVGAQKPMTRKHAILMGLLQGALEGAARTGKLGGAIGGAGVGGIAGAVNPKLEYALERKQEEDRVQADLEREQTNRAKAGQLGVQQSQILENQAQADRARLGTPHYEIDTKTGNLKVAYGSTAADVKDVNTGEAVQGFPKGAETEGQRKSREERADYHAKILAQREAAQKAKDADKVEVVVDGQKYRVSNAAAANIKVRQQQMRQSPNSAKAAAIEATIQNEAEKDALDRRKGTDEDIAKLQAQRDKITHQSVQRPDGTWGWEENPAAGFLHKTELDQIDRSISDLRKESDNQQRIAEQAAAKKREAEAKARAGGETVDWNNSGSQSQPTAPAGKGRPWSKSKWKAANPNGDEEAAARAVEARGDKVVP